MFCYSVSAINLEQKMEASGGSEYFNALADKINKTLFGRTVNDLKTLENILDQLNSVNYRCAIVTNETVRLLEWVLTSNCNP